MEIRFESFHGSEVVPDIALGIRISVFVEEQEIDADLEFDGKDPECLHFLMYVDSAPVATCRVRSTRDGIKLERFAVLKDFRNRGLGKQLLDEIMRNKIMDGKAVYLNSQVSALSFYKNNGFVIVGDKFYEAGIEHYKMIYRGQKK